MRRRWIADAWSPSAGRPTYARLTGQQAQHLARVLRAQPGQLFDVVAAGFLHRAEILSVRDDEVAFLLHEELQFESALPIHLLLAVFKFDPFEWAIEKATELGVARIQPILARRTDKHLGQAAAARVERWRRIAREAAQQSRRADVPAVADPVPLPLALETHARETVALEAPASAVPASVDPALSGAGAPAALAPADLAQPHPDQAHPAAPHSLRILLSETEQSLPLASALAAARPLAQTPLALAVGPEGGWAPEEMTLFTRHAWTHVTLGPRILRAETAAIAALAIASSILASPIRGADPGTNPATN